MITPRSASDEILNMAEHRENKRTTGGTHKIGIAAIKKPVWAIAAFRQVVPGIIRYREDGHSSIITISVMMDPVKTMIITMVKDTTSALESRWRVVR